jgi:hypothetical protein
MKSLGILICAGLISVFPAAAQFSMRTGSLGGPASAGAFSHPLGGVVSARGFSRPLGGAGSLYNGYAAGRYARGKYRGTIGYPYVYSTWVPDYYDYLDYQNQSGLPPDPYGPPPPAAAAPQQPVIINQYFSAPPPAAQPNTQPQGAASDTGNTSAQAPGDVIGEPKNYYLIAYKDHRVYPALAYWLEDKTLNYVTTENMHNQASLGLIDIPLTKSLNQRNDVPFSLPGQ